MLLKYCCLWNSWLIDSILWIVDERVSGVKRIVRELILLRGNYELTESKPVETKTEPRLQRSMDRNRKNFRSRRVVKGGMACVHRLNNSIQI